MTPELRLAQSLFPTRKPDSFSTEFLQACGLAIEAQSLPKRHVVSSLEAMEVLVCLNLDDNTYIATLLSDLNLEPFYSIENLERKFGSNTAKLVEGIRRLNQFKEFDVTTHSDEVQTERLRQMLLAMTSDIRIMVVKLSYRVARLRNVKREDETTRRQIAEETQLIFAPLANRLGIAQLKWELEDLSFRYLQPDTYRAIAEQLADKRNEREDYIHYLIDVLNNLLTDDGLNAQVSGRPKHIYSIWKKMTKKQQGLESLYDLRAVRIYVDSVSDCYRALSLVHSQWNFIREEFDDYITTPKENGYQSIHTVIIGPEGKTVEIQIRTHEMQQHAEYGIAAHWKYKEGGKGYDANLEASIKAMRQLLEARSDSDVFSEISTELQTQKIYVLTPTNQIIALPQGSTALDFAYAIHTDLGHSCRGAKVNGKIGALTHALKTGDKVEVLSIKHGEPNRNWLNPNLGYLRSSRARTSIKHWFNKRNRDANIESGEHLFQREIKRLHARQIQAKTIAQVLGFEHEKDLFDALGKGQLNERQLVNAIQKQLQPLLKTQPIAARAAKTEASNLEQQTLPYVVGAPKLRTLIAPCCQPEPGEHIVGYVTRGRGITIHRVDCANILNLTDVEQQRLIEVRWSNQPEEDEVIYLMTLHILAFDRKGLLRDVMGKLTAFDVNLVASNTATDREERTVDMQLELEIHANTDLSGLLDQLEALQNVEEVSIEQHGETS